MKMAASNSIMWGRNEDKESAQDMHYLFKIT